MTSTMRTRQSCIRTRQSKKLDFPAGLIRFSERRRRRPYKRVADSLASHRSHAGLKLRADKILNIHRALTRSARRECARNVRQHEQERDVTEDNLAELTRDDSDYEGPARTVRRVRDMPIKDDPMERFKNGQKVDDLCSAVQAFPVTESANIHSLKATCNEASKDTPVESKLRKRFWFNQVHERGKGASEASSVRLLRHLDKKIKTESGQSSELRESLSKTVIRSSKTVIRSSNGKLEEVSKVKEETGKICNTEEEIKPKKRGRKRKEAKAKSASEGCEDLGLGRNGSGVGLFIGKLTRAKLRKQFEDRRIKKQSDNGNLGVSLRHAAEGNAVNAADLKFEVALLAQNSKEEQFSPPRKIERGRPRKQNGMEAVTGININNLAGDFDEARETNNEVAEIYVVEGVNQAAHLHKWKSSRDEHLQDKNGEGKLMVCQNDGAPAMSDRKGSPMEITRERKQSTYVGRGKKIGQKRVHTFQDRKEALMGGGFTGLRKKEQMQSKKRKGRQKSGRTEIGVRGPITRGMKERGFTEIGAKRRKLRSGTADSVGVLLGEPNARDSICEEKNAVAPVIVDDKEKRKKRGETLERVEEQAAMMGQKLSGRGSRLIRRICSLEELKCLKLLRLPLKATSLQGGELKGSKPCLSTKDDVLIDDRSVHKGDGRVCNETFLVTEEQRAAEIGLETCRSELMGDKSCLAIPHEIEGSLVEGIEHDTHIQREDQGCEGGGIDFESVAKDGEDMQHKSQAEASVLDAPQEVLLFEEKHLPLEPLDNGGESPSSFKTKKERFINGFDCIVDLEIQEEVVQAGDEEVTTGMRHVKEEKLSLFEVTREASKGAAGAPEEVARAQQRDCGYSLGGDIISSHLPTDDQGECPFSPKRKRESSFLGSADKLVNEGIGMDDGACRVDSKKKFFLVATNPLETGGRQMRPRPLDVDQPLFVFVEGRDQEYYDYDGGLFHQMLQKQEVDFAKKHFEKVTVVNGGGGTQQGLSTKSKENNNIVIPSFRVLQKLDEGQTRVDSAYAMPKSYIKYSMRVVEECLHKAEFDMDEEDEEWLHNLNQTKLASGLLTTLSEDQFERIMGFFEERSAEIEDQKEELCFSKPALESKRQSLQQSHHSKHGAKCMDTNVPKDIFENETPGKVQHISEDCCICNGGENSSSNPVFRCVRCHIFVHQSCYGIREAAIDYDATSILKDNWSCRKCEAITVGRADPEVCCALCCKRGGALKPAVQPYKWVHVVCALYTNETFFVNSDAMEPIDGLDAAEIRARKQRRQCSLCGVREGSLERCSVKSCHANFHISCGVNQGASFELLHYKQQVVRVRPFCPKHANIAPVSRAMKDERFTGKKGKFTGFPEEASSGSADNATLTMSTYDATEGSSGKQRHNKKDQEMIFLQEDIARTDQFEGNTSQYQPQENDWHQSFLQGRSTFNGSDGEIYIQNRYRSTTGKSAADSDHDKGKTIGHFHFPSKCINTWDIQSIMQGSKNVDACYAIETSPSTQEAAGSRADDNREWASTQEQSGHQFSLGGETPSLESFGRTVNQDNGVILSLEEAMKTNLACSDDLEHVYWYWLSKRAKTRGPLLHRIQQERAAKKYGIFNKDVTEGKTLSSFFKQDLFRAGAVDLETVRKKMMAVQRQLQKLQEIIKLVIKRERIKCQIHSVEQEIAKFKLDTLRHSRRSCFWCKGTGQVLCCTICNKSFCFQCFRSRKGYGVKGWIVAMKLPKYVCSECQGDRQEGKGHELIPSTTAGQMNAHSKENQSDQLQDRCRSVKNQHNLTKCTFGLKHERILCSQEGFVDCKLSECDSENDIKKQELLEDHCEQVEQQHLLAGHMNKSVKCSGGHGPSDAEVCGQIDVPDNSDIAVPCEISEHPSNGADRTLWDRGKQRNHIRTVLLSELLKSACCTEMNVEVDGAVEREDNIARWCLKRKTKPSSLSQTEGFH